MVAATQHAQHGPMSGSDCPDRACRSWMTHPRDVAELWALIELSALRKLADRGLTDEELATSRRLARATVRSARGGDLPGYLEADAAFHLYLLGLTSNPFWPKWRACCSAFAPRTCAPAVNLLSASKSEPVSTVRSSLFLPMTWSARPARC
jgi:FCD domain